MRRLGLTGDQITGTTVRIPKGGCPLKNYAAVKQSILALGLKTTTFLDQDDGHERTARQRKISKILRDAKFDLASLFVALRSRFPDLAMKTRIRLGDGMIVFRGAWQTRHLLAVLAAECGVTNPELEELAAKNPYRAYPALEESRRYAASVQPALKSYD